MATNEKIAKAAFAKRKTAEKVETTCINLWVTIPFKHDVRLRAAELGMNVTDYIRGLIESDFAGSGGDYAPETFVKNQIRGAAKAPPDTTDR